MATFQKRGDSWRAIIRKHGVSISETFPSKTSAQAWAAKAEADIIAGKRGDIPDKTFGDLLIKYREEVTPTKRGSRWETVRINKYLKDPIARVHLRDLNSTHITAWRNRRLKEVGPGSVLREWNLLSNACKRARDEWKWLISHPMKGVEKPAKPDARDRIPSPEEIEAILHCAGYTETVPLGTATLRAIAAWQFSMETALRAGELCALEWHEVYLDKGYLTVAGVKDGARKNRAAIRDVPLTARAKQILEQFTHREGPVFSFSPTNLDTLFRKVRDRAGVEDLTYHDSRHVAITMLSKFYDVLALAKIVGHTNIKELMTYYNPTIADLVSKLE